MSDSRDGSDRPTAEQQPGTLKMEQLRNLPGGALVRTLPPQQRYIMAPVQSSSALISSTTTIQAQVLPKATVQGTPNTVGRISAIPVQSSATSTSGFHVPKGPAAVANISVPRSSNVATPIRGASLQAITVAPHSISGSASGVPAMHIGGRSMVSSVAPWVGISSTQQGNIPRHVPTQIRPTLQQITDDPPDRHPNLSTPNILTFSSSFSQPTASVPLRATPMYTHNSTGENVDVSQHNISSHEDSGAKISSQIRPLENRMLVHSSTTHKQVITQQAQVQLAATGNDPSKGQTTVLKSYGGAASATRVVAPPSTPGLSRIATIPPAIAVSLHSAGAGAAAAVLVPNSQGIPLKTTIAQPKVISQPVHSSTSVQFPSVCSATVQPALTLNTVQVSRPASGKLPALVTVMLSPSVPAGAGSHPSNVTHIKSHPGQGPPQLIQQSSGPGLGHGSTTIGKIYTDQHAISSTSQPVFIQTQGSIGSQVGQKTQQLPAALIVREPSRAKDDMGSSVSSSSSVNLHGGTVYSLGSYYDSQGYHLKVPQHHSSSLIVPPSATSHQTVHVRQATSQVPPMSSATPQGQLRLNPAMVVETSRPQVPFSTAVDSSTSMSSDTNMATLALTSQGLKQTTSPRPSILRKREPEGSPIKVTKNLAPVLKGLTVSAGSPPGPSSPKRPESGQSGQSSSGSTTESAHSSPGESPTPVLKQEHMEDDLSTSVPSIITSVSSKKPVPAISRPPTSSAHVHPPPTSSAHTNEMSPRKKPRKQQLSGNQIVSEPTFSEDEMEFMTEDKMKKEIKEEPIDEPEKVVQKKTMSLLSSYKHNWKGRNNHFNRYTDVKPKEERKPTLSEIANQKNVAQKLTGWKIYHIASHLEDLANSETEFVTDYNATLCFLEDKLSKCRNREMEKDFHRVTERVRANCQRSRVVKDHMVEAKTQLFKLLEHKAYITDIIQRNTIKRPLKKRERM